MEKPISQGANIEFKKTVLSSKNEEPERKAEANETMFLFYKFSNEEEDIDCIWEPEAPFEVKVGSEEFIPGFNACLQSMFVGERARFEFYSEEYQESQILEIWLIDSRVAPKQKWDYSPAERLQMAQDKKAEADQLLKTGDPQVSFFYARLLF